MPGNAADLAGYVAGGLIILAFSTGNPLLLRVLALMANAAFIAYALLAELQPVLTLHVILAAINAWQLAQMLALPAQRLPDDVQAQPCRPAGKGDSA